MKNYTITVNGNVYDVVVEEGAADSCENDDEVVAHHALDFLRCLQNPDDGIDVRNGQSVQRQRDAPDEQKRREQASLHARLVLRPELEGEHGPASHAESDENGVDEHHQRVGRPYGGQRSRSEKPPHDERVCDVVALLQQIARHQRKGKTYHGSHDVALRQVPCSSLCPHH